MKIDPDAFRAFFEDLIPFNKYLGMKLFAWDEEKLTVTSKLKLKPEFIGNPIKNMPHGGVISSLIDVTAGTATALSLDDLSYADRITTIDMRVDYLKPSKGNILFAESEVIRSGKRIVVVRTDVHDDYDITIALGTNSFAIIRD